MGQALGQMVQQMLPQIQQIMGQGQQSQQYKGIPPLSGPQASPSGNGLMGPGNTDIPQGMIGGNVGAPQPWQNPAYPESWINEWRQQNPATQDAMKQRFEGRTQGDIENDWNTNIAPRYPQGTNPSDILNGTAQSGTQRDPNDGLNFPSGRPTGTNPWMDQMRHPTPVGPSPQPSMPFDRNPQRPMYGMPAPNPIPQPAGQLPIRSGNKGGVPPVGGRDTSFWVNNPNYTGSSLQFDTSENNYHGGPYSHEAIWEEPGKKTPMALPTQRRDNNLMGQNYRSKSSVRF